MQRNGLPKTMGWRSQGTCMKDHESMEGFMGTFACFHDWTHNGSEIIQTYPNIVSELSLYSNLLTTRCRCCCIHGFLGTCWIPGRYFIVGSWNVTSSNIMWDPMKGVKDPQSMSSSLPRQNGVCYLIPEPLWSHPA